MEVLTETETNKQHHSSHKENAKNEHSSKSVQKYQPQIVFREWSTNAHKQDEDLKWNYWIIIEADDQESYDKNKGKNNEEFSGSHLLSDKELHELFLTIKQPLTKNNLQEVFSKTQEIISHAQKEVLEPMLFQNEYSFQDQKQLKIFQEIQKWTKMIWRKQAETSLRNKNQNKQKLQEELEKMRNFFIKNFRLRGKWVSDKEIHTIAELNKMDYKQLSTIQKQLIKEQEVKNDQKNKLKEQKKSLDQKLDKKLDNKIRDKIQQKIIEKNDKKQQSTLKEKRPKSIQSKELLLDTLKIQKNHQVNNQQQIKFNKDEKKSPQQKTIKKEMKQKTEKDQKIQRLSVQEKDQVLKESNQQKIKYLQENYQQPKQNSDSNFINEITIQNLKQISNNIINNIEYYQEPIIHKQVPKKSIANKTSVFKIETHNEINAPIQIENKEEFKQQNEYQTYKAIDLSNNEQLIALQTQHQISINNEVYIEYIYQPVCLNFEFYLLSIFISESDHNKNHLIIKNTFNESLFKQNLQYQFKELQELIVWQIKEEENQDKIQFEILNKQQEKILKGSFQTHQQNTQQEIQQILEIKSQENQEQFLNEQQNNKHIQINLQKLHQANSPSQSLIINLLQSFYDKQIDQAIIKEEKIQKITKNVNFSFGGDKQNNVSLNQQELKWNHIDGKRRVQSLGNIGGEQIKIIELEPLLVGKSFVTQQVIQRQNQERKSTENLLITKDNQGNIINQTKLFDGELYLDALTNKAILNQEQNQVTIELIQNRQSISRIQLKIDASQGGLLSAKESEQEMSSVKEETINVVENSNQVSNVTVQDLIQQITGSEIQAQRKQSDQKRLTKYSELMVFQELKSEDFDHPQEAMQYKEKWKRMTQIMGAPFETEKIQKENRSKSLMTKLDYQEINIIEKASKMGDDFWKDFKRFCEDLKFDSNYIDSILFATFFYYRLKQNETANNSKQG